MGQILLKRPRNRRYQLMVNPWAAVYSSNFELI